MTKVQKLNDDLYKFVNEDDGTATLYKGEAVQKAFNELNETPKRVQSGDIAKRLYAQRFSEIEQFFNSQEYLNNKSEIERALKQLKDVKEIKIKTNEKAYNRERYDKFMRERVAEFNKTTAELNDMMNSCEIGSDEWRSKYSTLLQFRRELESQIKLTNKSENQFYDDVYKTIKTSPFEAYNTVLRIIEHRKEGYNEARNNELNKQIECDKSKLSWIKSDDDFQFIKRLHSLINKSAFYNMFEGNSYYELIDALRYDSLNDYFNRDRGELRYDMPELTLSDTENTLIAFVQSIIDKIRHNINVESLKSEIAAEIARECVLDDAQ